MLSTKVFVLRALGDVQRVLDAVEDVRHVLADGVEVADVLVRNPAHGAVLVGRINMPLLPLPRPLRVDEVLDELREGRIVPAAQASL